jgi:hypothetical protein
VHSQVRLRAHPVMTRTWFLRQAVAQQQEQEQQQQQQLGAPAAAPSESKSPRRRSSADNYSSKRRRRRHWTFPRIPRPSLLTTMKVTLWSALLFLLSQADFSAASDTSKTGKPLKPCTARSPTTERFFDLNPIHRKLKDKDDKRRKEDVVESWHARGWDYGANFTINFCGPVVEDLTNVQGLDEKLWKNVSAYYEIGDKQYALG